VLNAFPFRPGVMGQGGVQEQDSRERKAILERTRDNGVDRRDGSRTRGNDCILNIRSMIQDVA
jgi:hypothetical protein